MTNPHELILEQGAQSMRLSVLPQKQASFFGSDRSRVHNGPKFVYVNAYNCDTAHTKIYTIVVDDDTGVCANLSPCFVYKRMIKC